MNLEHIKQPCRWVCWLTKYVAITLYCCSKWIWHESNTCTLGVLVWVCRPLYIMMYVHSIMWVYTPFPRLESHLTGDWSRTFSVSAHKRPPRSGASSFREPGMLALSGLPVFEALIAPCSDKALCWCNVCDSYFELSGLPIFEALMAPCSDKATYVTTTVNYQDSRFLFHGPGFCFTIPVFVSWSRFLFHYPGFCFTVPVDAPRHICTRMSQVSD
jgi:hypothetical protein